MSPAPFTLRAATIDDMPRVVELVRGLAAFEKLAAPDDAAAERLTADAFGPRPRFEVLVAETDRVVVAYAIHFPMYSTFAARPTLYLEDLFVEPAHRGAGIGAAMLRRLAALAVERGAGRFDWTVLDWNEGAQRFYRSMGAEVMSHWWTCRLEGEALVAAARGG